MLLPALANSQPDSRTFRCMNNQRQLMVAWRMYAEDNNDYLAGNDFPWMSLVSSITPALARANWAPGSMILSGDNTNVANLKNPAISQLFSYLKTADVFKCPADKSVVVRSVSMNSAVGTRWTYASIYTPPAGVQRGSQPLEGGWLPGSSYNASQTTWLTYGKFSSMVRPTPAGLFVIMDEHPDGINDSTIAIPAVPGFLVDYPASYHDGGAGGLAFADGHTEMHRWVDTRTKPPITGNPNSIIAGSSPNNQDTVWLSQRTSALR
jgi:prepilin-type processing-associated H-X9-DG protein